MSETNKTNLVPNILTDHDKEVRISEGRNYIKTLTEIEIKNAEAFDKSILSLSTGALGLSIAFLDKIIPYDKAIFLILLIVSWIGFSIVIIINIISHFTSQKECALLKGHAEEHYFNFKDEYGVKLRRFKSKTASLNKWSGNIFIVSILLIVSFVTINITQGGSFMSKENRPSQQTGQTPKPEVRTPAGPRVHETKAGTHADNAVPAIPPSAPSDTSTVDKK